MNTIEFLKGHYENKLENKKIERIITHEKLSAEIELIDGFIEKLRSLEKHYKKPEVVE